MSTRRSATTTHIGVGIDTARYGHRVSFLREDRQPAAPPINITENRQGYQELSSQLEKLYRKHPNALFHVHIDAAGQYATNLEQFLRSLHIPVNISIGEPKRNKDYHKVFFPKRTTDDTESLAMARFGVVEQPAHTPDIPNEFYLLREVCSRLQGQVKDSTRSKNRLHNLLARVFPELATIVSDLGAAWVLTMLKRFPTPQQIANTTPETLRQIPYIKADKALEIHAAARSSIGSLAGKLAESLVIASVEHLERCLTAQKNLENLLVQAYEALPPSGHLQVSSIPGIGVPTAAVLVAKMISIDRFPTPENLVGYFGIFPEENTSGVDRNGQPVQPGTMQMSAKGNDLVRRYLWNAAKSAIDCNPPVRELYKRLRARGRRGDVALGQCMRKLLHQVHGVWTSDKPFDANYRPSRKASEPDTSAPSPAEQKTAAGHKRDIPPSKVVTAANTNVPPVKPTVNQATAVRDGSIDYAYVREQVTMQQVLAHLGYFDRLRGSGSERRGPCPLHGSKSSRSRSFSVNLKKNVYKCFHEGCSQGNVLDFWQALHRLPLYEATQHLADTFHVSVKPEQKREDGARNHRQHKKPAHKP